MERQRGLFSEKHAHTVKEDTATKEEEESEESRDLVYSAYVDDNGAIFPKILRLHVPDGAKIADVTYGKGVFWREVDTSKYDLWKSDIKDESGEESVESGVDCRDLPYEDGEMDVVVLDPPYKEGFYRDDPDHKPGVNSHRSFREAYSSGEELNLEHRGSSKWQDAVLDMYLAAGKEAHRVLAERGVLIVKCQDAVSANRQWLTHVSIINAYAEFGFYAKDLFVMVRNGWPGISNVKNQVHARKRHSYFLVFVKCPEGKEPEKMRSKSIG